MIVFTYEDFISEIRLLASEARQFTMKSEHDVTFQTWQHRLKDVLDRICAEGHRPSCGVAVRTFRNMWAQNRSEAERAFTDDLKRTLIEIDTIINSYEKFGVPRTPGEIQKRVTPTVPQQPSHALNIFGGIHGGYVQIGDHNTQTIVNALQALKDKIDSANASPEEKQEATGLLNGLLTHPLVTSILGGLAGASPSLLSS